MITAPLADSAYATPEDAAEHWPESSAPSALDALVGEVAAIDLDV